MLDLEKLNKFITFISESYLYTMEYLDSDKIKRKKVKLTREHLSSLIEAMHEILYEYERILDTLSYGMKVNLLRFLIEAYDSLAKGIKAYHYQLRREEGDVEQIIGDLSISENNGSLTKLQDES